MDSQRFDRFTKAFGTRLSRRSALRAGFGLGGFALAGATSVTAAQEATPVATPGATGKPTETLFVQTFERGSVMPKVGIEGEFILTLYGDHGRTVAFSDRPERLVSSSATQDFLNGLGFSPHNPPNAALVIEPSHGQSDVLVLELLDPTYQEAEQRLTYHVKPLENFTEQMGLRFEETPRLPDPTGEVFGAAQLFIDDCPDLTVCLLAGGMEGPIPGGGPWSQCWANGTCSPSNCSDSEPTIQALATGCNNLYEGCAGGCQPG